MLRRLHSVLGLAAALLVVVIAVSGAVLSLDPTIDRVIVTQPVRGQTDVATLADALQTRLGEVDKIERKASGAVVVTYFAGDRAAIERVDPVTGASLGPWETSPTTRFVTRLHRSLLMGDGGRIAVGASAFVMVLLSISGAMMLAGRLGGWRALARPIRGTAAQRWHGELGRLAMVGLLVSGLTGSVMTLSTFGLVPDGSVETQASEGSGGPRAPVGTLAALRSIDVADFRELTFPYASDPTDVYTLTTDADVRRIDAASGAVLGVQAQPLSGRVLEIIRMLHTGRGLWALGLVLGLIALTVPALAGTGAVVWWARRRARPRIAHNAGAQVADTILLVGSEGNATWGFAATLHAALTTAGHRVHTGAMNDLLPDYRSAERMVILTSTHGDGDAPASATRFLTRLAAVRHAPPVAVLGFGDRSFPNFCGFAEVVEGELAARGWPRLLPIKCIDRQSAQDFAAWGRDLGAVIGIDLDLVHVAARPKTQALRLVARDDYGTAVGAPTSILRFRAPLPERGAPWWRRLFAPRLPNFEAGDLVGIVPPGSDVPRFYSLASSSSEGFLEICVRRQPNGLCSGYLHDLAIGGRIDMFIRANPSFRPDAGTEPLILIGAGAGLGPLAGFIRGGDRRREVHLYWGGRDPASDFLYREELADHLADTRLTRLATAFSRVPGGGYVQDRIARDAGEVRTLIAGGAQVLVCGGRDMATAVAATLERILDPTGLDLATLRAEGRYIEDVY